MRAASMAICWSGTHCKSGLWPYPTMDPWSRRIMVDRVRTPFSPRRRVGRDRAIERARRDRKTRLGRHRTFFDQVIWTAPAAPSLFPPIRSWVAAGGTLLQAPTSQASRPRSKCRPTICWTRRKLYRAVPSPALAESSSRARTSGRMFGESRGVDETGRPLADRAAALLCMRSGWRRASPTTMGGDRDRCAGRGSLARDGAPFPGLLAAGSLHRRQSRAAARGYVGGFLKAVTLGLIAAEPSAPEGRSPHTIAFGRTP